MKRILISIMMLAVMLSGMMNVHATEAQVKVELRASKSQVQVGETVEYTVLVTGSGVVAMQFELRCPAGLSYVPNSGATPENLAQKLGVPAADWTELSKMFTFYNDIGINFAPGTEICRFSCVAQQEGVWAPELYELLPFDENFEEFAPEFQVQQIRVSAPGDQIPATEPEQPADPVVPQTQPTEPDRFEQATEPATVPATEPVTEPVTEPDHQNPETTAPVSDEDVSTDKPQDILDSDLTNEEPETSAPDQNTQNQEKPAKNNLFWLLLLGIAVVIGGGVAVFILLKKKAS